jgi:hypothetical protein
MNKADAGQNNDGKSAHLGSRSHVVAIWCLGACSIAIVAIWAWVLIELYLHSTSLSNWDILATMAVVLLFLLFRKVSNIDGDGKCIDETGRSTSRSQAAVAWIVRAGSIVIIANWVWLLVKAHWHKVALSEGASMISIAVILWAISFLLPKTGRDRKIVAALAIIAAVGFASLTVALLVATLPAANH